jgi:DNA topoisomerase-3
MRLIVAEKPSVGRAIAEALGVRGGGREAIRGGSVAITWCVGHLGELAVPERYDPALKSWSWATLPILPEKFKFDLHARTKSQFAAVRALMHDPQVTEIVNACDAGREGELIFDIVQLLARNTKPVLRMWPKAMTEEAIRDAYERAQPAARYQGLRDAAHCRARADWLVGMNGTRAQTLAARARGHQGKGNVGRVMTPTLNLIYLRDEAIRVFVPKDYWTVHARFRAEAGEYEGKWVARRGDEEVERFDTRDEARALVERLQGLPARVARVDRTEKRTPPEQLYDLTTLQREANRRWGYTAEDTLKVAQRLYEEHKALTYPRTSSRHLLPATEATLPRRLAALRAHPVLGPLAAEVLRPDGTLPKRGKRFVDAAKVEDHDAILPTGRVPQGLDEKEARIWELVVRRTIAMYLPDRVDAKTKILTRVGTEVFRTRGSVCLEPGWSRVDPSASATRRRRPDDEDDEQAELPDVRRDETPEVLELWDRAGKTRPPRPLTDADLLAAMETAGKTIEDDELRAAMRDAGLGTPATRAATIEKLLATGLVERQKKTLRCTADGRALIESIEVEILKSPELTGQWEAKLARMARGDYPREAFMDEIRAFTRDLVRTVRGALPAEALAEFQPKPLAPCITRDGGTLVLRRARSGFYVKCDHAGCKVAWDADETGAPVHGRCEKCRGPVRATKTGRRVCVKCQGWQEGPAPKGPDASKTGWVRSPIQEACPRGCGGTLQHVSRADGGGKPFVGCATRGCDFRRDPKPLVAKSPARARKKANGGPGTEPVGRWRRTATGHTCPGCGRATLVLLQKGGPRNEESFYACDARCGYRATPDEARVA